MRAYVMTRYGAPADVVACMEVAEPTPRAGEIVCDIHAAGLNPIDIKTIQGALKRVETHAMPHRIGFDASGVVRAIGSGVTGFAIGDAVFVRASRENTGTFAERIALPAAYFAKKPRAISHVEAASLPLVGLTTVQGLTDRARAQAGQRILIHAGSGGVGSFAVQYAKHLGLHVTSTTSSRNADFVTSLGADTVITYDTQDYRTLPDRYDIVFDTIGGAATEDAFKVCKRGGNVVSIVGPPDWEMAAQLNAGLIPRIAMRLMARKVFALSAATGVQYHRFLTTSDGRQLAEIATLVDAGKIRPVMDRTFPFDQLPQALAHLALGRSRGKVVLQVR